MRYRRTERSLWRRPMSIEAIAWALNHAPIPCDRKDSSSLAIVLIGLANHADPNGRNAFPSVATLTRYSRLSERTVRTSLDRLEELGLISPSDPDIVAAYIKRADRRPKGWDLAVHSGVQSSHPADLHGVHSSPDGVQSVRPRGASTAPEPSLNLPGTKRGPARDRARAVTTALPAECGSCDARPGDPVSARVIWLDSERERSTPCPRCSVKAEVAR
ncbi:hypothetical protein GCM10022247_56610 [Allokutzneria multivorans]|uniref:Helix-turn-helix domain-containing protein n=1 Tax=Allokutzneria multivorans TaxID=1142134 RepID=A0ABP7TE05_9PSEU